ncbi:MAG: TetR/AcrR family transcriptional regulator [Deltaproteobacteria bacterium]|jgi:AcrR family transcriptional regulator|nr:TetR/AcrR family transcriptional regulator [Deltaproteobacteria bacterium]
MADHNRRRSVGRPHSDPASEQKIRKSIMASCLKTIGTSVPLKFTIKEVARMAGVSPASIYYYFGDRDKLNKETYDHYFQSRFKRLNELLTSCKSPMELLVKIFISFQNATLEEPNIFRLYVLDYFKVPNVSFQEPDDNFPAPNTAGMLAILKKGQDDGILRQGIMFELMYLTLLAGALMGIGFLGRVEQMIGEKIDPKKARDHFLYLFCISMEGPKCDYDWRSIHFPDGVPGES